MGAELQVLVVGLELQALVLKSELQVGRFISTGCDGRVESIGYGVGFASTGCGGRVASTEHHHRISNRMTKWSSLSNI